MGLRDLCELPNLAPVAARMPLLAFPTGHVTASVGERTSFMPIPLSSSPEPRLVLLLALSTLLHASAI